MLFGRYVCRKSIEFDGGAGTGAQGTTDIFTVSDAAHVVVVAYCTEDLVGATATIEVGTDDLTAALIAQTTAENIDNGEIWFDDAPSECETQTSIGGAWIYDNIAYTVGTADITDGEVTFVCYWTPMAAGATVEPT
jgi:hypothetical protein